MSNNAKDQGARQDKPVDPAKTEVKSRELSEKDLNAVAGGQTASSPDTTRYRPGNN